MAPKTFTNCFPVRAGEYVAVFLTEDVARLLNELAELNRRCGVSPVDPDIYLITAAGLDLRQQVRHAQSALDLMQVKGAEK